ncbi:reverse transcriptase [Elysia marginata]|uniref:Reverse transcriptase n=1 Tax=Elysia marginata TaxID=1093978 RepID=A0AAV4F425_9GAST|nr:reverse transcriptase [Elysia marginata]
MSNVGTPQGDSLSPVLFTIYLENALREIRTTLPEPNSSYGREIPSEIAYADDLDFIGHDYAKIAKIQETLEKYQLKVKTDKTEFTLLSKSEEDWKK